MNYYFNSPEQVKRDMAYDEYKFVLALHYYQCGLTAFNKIATQRDFVSSMKFKDALAYDLTEVVICAADKLNASLTISNSTIQRLGIPERRSRAIEEHDSAYRIIG